MNWKSWAKQIAIGLVIVAIAAYLSRTTAIGKRLFATA